MNRFQNPSISFCLTRKEYDGKILLFFKAKSHIYDRVAHEENALEIQNTALDHYDLLFRHTRCIFFSCKIINSPDMVFLNSVIQMN